VFERKVIRKIYGPIYNQGVQLWRKRYDQELMDIFKRPSIMNEIKRSRIEWAGYSCKKQNAMIQRVLQEDPRSKRPLGRPRLRWKDGIRKHFLNARGENYGDGDWKEAAVNREEWKRIYDMAIWS